jgi:hypothetical protein
MHSRQTTGFANAAAFGDMPEHNRDFLLGQVRTEQGRAFPL